MKMRKMHCKCILKYYCGSVLENVIESQIRKVCFFHSGRLYYPLEKAHWKTWHQTVS